MLTIRASIVGKKLDIYTRAAQDGGMDDTPKCDTCGKPATNFAQDYYVQDQGISIISEPVQQVKCGCDRHPAKSLRIDIGMSLFGDNIL